MLDERPIKKSKRPYRPRPVIEVNPDCLVDKEFQPDEWSLAFGHIPVLARESVLALNIKENGVYVDLTMGGGGHTRQILSQLGPKGRLLALDRDAETLIWAGLWGQGDPRLILKKANFDDIDSILAELKLGRVDGMLADLGLSSRQLFGPGRGFSWQIDEPLDMRMDPESGVTAYDIVNSWPEHKLIDLIRFIAEERSGFRLAKRIVEERAKKPLKTTGDLADLVSKVLRRSGHHARTNPATKVFMGIRLVVNREMEALATLLKKAPGCLKPEGRLVVISFQSLEDRQVKKCFCSMEGKKIWDNLFKKPITPTELELENNHRSRSAKLRIGRLKRVVKEKTIPTDQ
ncbi:MAG: 16S rRNA (cytosine(1402)-N(4))-methyltransferase RsmH [Deltaproteobacteria bacterium]|jgi:16S rRNA (cytosine1402-N4)-methyltransferase|nr:16S rRNA (cytosine(1402)-N(4))-methyltransferase RsmH [Deltaproteobacteria bacterium]